MVRQAWGEPDEIIDLTYLPLEPIAENGDAMMLTIVNDRVGNVSEHWFDLSNKTVRLREYTGRADADQPTTETVNRPSGKLRASDPDTSRPVTPGMPMR